MPTKQPDVPLSPYANSCDGSYQHAHNSLVMDVTPLRKRFSVLAAVLSLLSISCAEADVAGPSSAKDVVPFIGDQLLSFALKGGVTFHLKDLKSGTDGTFQINDNVLHVDWHDVTNGRVIVINRIRLCAAMDDINKFHCYRLYTHEATKAQCAYYLADLESRNFACLKQEIKLAP